MNRAQGTCGIAKVYKGPRIQDLHHRARTTRRILTRIKQYQSAVQNLRQMADSTDRHFMEAVIPYSRQENLALAHRMQERLPLELRTLVYKHYWSTYEGDLAKLEQYSWDISTHICPADGSCAYADWDTLPPLVLPPFVGLEAAREAVAVAMEHFRPGAFVLQRYAPELDVFLKSDPFHVGVSYGQHIRAVSVEIQDSIRQTPGSMSPISMSNIQTLKEHLRALLQIRLKRGFELSVCIDCWTSAIDLERTFEILREVYGIFMKQGPAWVRIRPDLTRELFGMKELPDGMLPNYYSMPLEEWRDMYEITSVIEEEAEEHEELEFDESESVP
ncbi:hypothetical protein BDV95DRAFT_610365 [Massariosphaeria phaeospora]|uniref:Uncharacterized protein n=1 Tax=Massariosphaeria phaeospora TaxID=100035 RepID=A0A7C8I119_9PLEO|nr:hypothetical protein BDV95DRAFT_610365 [Massariosphaeria phaeospora]